MWSCLTLGCAFAQTVHVVVWCAVQGPYRSRSAPREEAAARRHIERMNASPNRTTAAAVAASRDSILAGQQQQALPSWQREQAVRQSGGNLRGSAGFSSPSAKKVCVCVCWRYWRGWQVLASLGKQQMNARWFKHLWLHAPIP